MSIEPETTLTGRVYFDVNNDGVFQDGGQDKGLGDVAVWLDRDRSVLTDRRGAFRFEHVKPGAHALRAELEGVPADLVFAESADRMVAAVPYGRNSQEFRVVATGSVAAQVFVREETDGQAAGVDRPVPDVRIIADAEHDSYTDLNGNLLITALPPGTYRLHLDRETIPAGYLSVPDTAEVEVRPGEAVKGVQFLLAPAPKDIIRRTLGAQASVDVVTSPR